MLVAQLCPTFCSPMDCNLPSSSLHGILQARILEWGAISYSREYSQCRDWTHMPLMSPALVDRFFTSNATWKAHSWDGVGQTLWLFWVADKTRLHKRKGCGFSPEKNGILPHRHCVCMCVCVCTCHWKPDGYNAGTWKWTWVLGCKTSYLW